MGDQLHTMNLSDSGDGMVSLNNPYVPAPMPQNNNISQNKDTMDSTPISDIMGGGMGMGMGMMDPPSMSADPRMQAMGMNQLQPQQQQQQQAPSKSSKNPLNLTDDQLSALIVGVCTAIAISKPVQEKLSTTIPQFIGEDGARSMVGLATTGLVAALIFFITQKYILNR